MIAVHRRDFVEFDTATWADRMADYRDLRLAGMTRDSAREEATLRIFESALDTWRDSFFPRRWRMRIEGIYRGSRQDRSRLERQLNLTQDLLERFVEIHSDASLMSISVGGEGPRRRRPPDITIDFIDKRGGIPGESRLLDALEVLVVSTLGAPPHPLAVVYLDEADVEDGSDIGEFVWSPVRMFHNKASDRYWRERERSIESDGDALGYHPTYGKTQGE